MLFALLGKLDLITVLVILGGAILPQKFLVYVAFYLILKGLFFGFAMKDFASKIDLLCGIYLLIMRYFTKIPYVHGLVLFWLIQKTALTFIAIFLKLYVYYYHYKDTITLPFIGEI